MVTLGLEVAGYLVFSEHWRTARQHPQAFASEPHHEESERSRRRCRRKEDTQTERRLFSLSVLVRRKAKNTSRVLNSGTQCIYT